MSILSYIRRFQSMHEKGLIVLIDPEKTSSEKAISWIEQWGIQKPDLIFLGGSTFKGCLDDYIADIKSVTDIPIVLFPGHSEQFSSAADALLMLSLLSGRNAEWLIGQHVKAAARIRASQIETIPTGYILVDGGCETAVAMATGTTPLSTTNIEEIVATAIAGELLGEQLVYLEAGSGAARPVPMDVIQQVRSALRIPLIVGGGICSAEALCAAYEAGADLVVIGNHFEKEPGDLALFGAQRKK